MRADGPQGRRARQDACKTTTPDETAPRPDDLVDREFTGARSQPSLGRRSHLRAHLGRLRLRRLRHRRLLAASSSAGRPPATCAPTWPSTPWRWPSGSARAPARASSTTSDRGVPIPLHPLHRAPRGGRRRDLGRQPRRQLRQRHGRERHRPLQDRGDPKARDPGRTSRTSSSRPSNGSTGSTTCGCLNRSATSHRRSSRRCTMLSLLPRKQRRDSNKRGSTEPGAVQRARQVGSPSSLEARQNPSLGHL